MKYIEFIKNKEIKQDKTGINVEINELNPKLFDFQKLCVKKALSVGRFALFEACGLGKTFQQLEWAYQIYKYTGKNVLIVAPLGVTKQTADEEALQLGYHVKICRSQNDVEQGLNITNYEMLDKFDCNSFIGVVLDESSILKNFTGSTRTKLNEYFKNTKYKLCCTATPAPNDLMELLNHADFLGIMETAKALSNFFINDLTTGKWRLKGHATDDFYKWCCTWSINIEKPSDIGFSDNGYNLPKLTEIKEIIEISDLADDFENGFFRNINTSATSFNIEKRNTADDRAKRTAEIVNNDKENQYLIWCDLNDEADLLKKYIPDAIEVRGSDKAEFKEQASYDFKHKNIRVLISKPRIFGYGMNFQSCHNVIFCGLTYSFENYYQALRRIYRFGQKNDVKCYIVLGRTEIHILETIEKKRKMQEELKNQMSKSVEQIQLEFIKNNGKEKMISTDKLPIIPKFI